MLISEPLQPVRSRGVTRRHALASTLLSGAGLALGWHRAEGRFLAPSAASADKLVPGKDRRLLVHNASPSGFEFETPLAVLREDRVTPAEKLFVRNNQQPDWSATLEAPQPGPWKLEISGLLEFPKTIAIDALRDLPQTEHEMVLQCSGNGRALFAAAAAVKGAAWQHGAMGNVRFKGVALRTIFDKFDVRPHALAGFITAEGADLPGKADAADFEHSLPLADSLARSIVALELNGKPLPAVHGGPLRLVTPGYYGTMHVKWLTRLRLEAQETVNHHQVKRYRTPREPLTPGSEFDYGFQNSDANWRMRIKSVVFAPEQQAVSDNGRFEVRGVAWNDGTSLLDAVELSWDGGGTWRRAELQRASRYAWQHWQLAITLPQGPHQLICRAVDTLGNTQPLDGTVGWNPAGYGWHGADRIEVGTVKGEE
ncbi:MAG: sulfite oxidase [Planctomycetes bacterium]|nr:sulfite oxidase [Planctomycetota bacterium]